MTSSLESQFALSLPDGRGVGIRRIRPDDLLTWKACGGLAGRCRTLVRRSDAKAHYDDGFGRVVDLDVTTVPGYAALGRIAQDVAPFEASRRKDNCADCLDTRVTFAGAGKRKAAAADEDRVFELASQVLAAAGQP